MKDWRLGLLLTVAFAALTAAVPGRCDNDQLVVVQDESSMERTVEAYLKAHYDAEVTEKTIGEGDLALVVKMDGKGGPDFNIVVDTQASNKKDDGTVLERVVSVQVYSGVAVPDGRRAAMLEAINKFQAGMWFASIYLDEDKELSCQWCLNVMKQPVPTEYAADAILRLADAWRKFRVRAEEVLGGG